MKQDDPTKLPASLLNGLNDLIAEQGNPYILSSMYESCFPKWIKGYCGGKLKKQSQAESDPHYDAVIRLMATSVDGCR